MKTKPTHLLIAAHIKRYDVISLQYLNASFAKQSDFSPKEIFRDMVKSSIKVVLNYGIHIVW